MDVVDLEKEELLASIRLQEEALSLSVPDTSHFITCDSDSDEDTYQDVPVTEVAPDDEEEKQPTWADALTANMEYDEALARVEQDIKLNIERIEKELLTVRGKISHLSGEISAVKASRGHWTYVFGMPYFKDSNFFPCPRNEDYLNKKKNHEICWSELPQFHQWIPKLKRKLVGAVKKLSLQKCETKARVKLAGLRKDLEIARENQDHERIAILEEQVASFNLDEEAKRMLPDTIENDDHDWMQISAKYLNGRQSPEGCRSFWLMYMHPKINKGPWTSDEESNLKKIAKRHYLEDWEKIAEELGTKRSGYQCFIVYQTKLNDTLKRSAWTEEEDQKLLEVIEQNRIGDYIPWGKVAFCMDGRTKAQVFNRWTYSLNPTIRKGRFTTTEDIMILVGVNMWGENFQRIANFMKDRTTCQVRDRFKNYLSRGDIGLPWAAEDDQRLMVLVETYGRNWAKISEHFPSKDRTQVRHRYNTISKWRETHPDTPLQDVPMRRFGNRTQKDFRLQWEKARAILSCETIDEMVIEKEKLVSTLQDHKILKRMQQPKKKRSSLVEADMINYFRCCYDVPGGRRKYQLRAGEADKYADEVINLMGALDVNLKLPCMEDIMSDRSLTYADKDILTAVSLKKAAAGIRIKESPPDSPERLFTDEFLYTGESASPWSDRTPTSSTLGADFISPASNIDYVQAHAASSVYIDLPLLNFQKDEIIVDKRPNVCIDTCGSSGSVDFLFVSTNGGNSSERESNIVKSKKPEELYVCPSNFTNLVGLRTYLLNRRTLTDWSNRDRYVCRFSEVRDEKVKKAVDLFNKRMLSLFLWPALMSRTAPPENQIFFEAGEKPPKWTFGFPPLKRKGPPDDETVETRPENQPSNNAEEPVEKSSESTVPKSSKKRKLLCPTSGDFVSVEEESCSSGIENSDKESTNESEIIDEDSREVEVIDIEDNSSELPSSIQKPIHFCDIAGDSSTDVQFCEADDSNEISYRDIPSNSPVGFDGMPINEDLNAQGRFISGPDISLASVQGPDNPNFQDVEVLEEQSHGFAANPAYSELVKASTSTAGNVINVGKLCPYTGRFNPSRGVPLAYTTENTDEDSDDVSSIDI